MPRVLFSSPECRAVVIDLQGGDELGDHQVRERAVVEVVAGRISIKSSGETVECESGLLLLLAPWPAATHNTQAEEDHGQHLPSNPVATPILQGEAMLERSL